MTQSLNNFPENIRKYYECKLLHDKYPFWDGEYEEFEGKKFKKIVWKCKECDKISNAQNLCKN